MTRSQIHPLPKFFDRYILLVDDVELVQGLVTSLEDFESTDFENWKQLGDRAYAPNKWTLKDILQHLIDNERVQSYRAMRFARNDKTVLPGYDQDVFATNVDTKRRTIEDLIEEFIAVRNASILLFKHMDEEMLQRVGVAYQIEITPLALGFQLIGHQIHHFKVIQERYMPLLNS